MLGSSGGFRYDFSGALKEVTSSNTHELDSHSFTSACEFLRSDVIGHDAIIQTPFGNRRLLYADFTASGRSLKSIEDFITSEVLPFYGNTHTLSSATGSQTTYFRLEARQIIKQYLNATHENALIFCGSGTTAAIQKFIAIMDRANWNLAAENILLPKSTEISSAAKNITGLQPDQALSASTFFREDRWGSCECSLCGVRLKNERLYRAHEHSDGHRRLLEKLHKHNHTATSSEPFQKTEASNCEDTRLDNSNINNNSFAQKPSRTHRLIVFLCDPTAHHSSLLPFREILNLSQGKIQKRQSIRQHDNSVQDIFLSFNIVQLRIDSQTCRLDENHLLTELIHCSNLQRAIIESHSRLERNTTGFSQVSYEVIPVAILSAGSNVTGLQVDVARLNTLVHYYNGIICWDFAAAAAHSKIDINPADSNAASIDVGFFSPHKLLGGPGSPGFLIIRKSLLRNATPSVSGGGVVFYVSNTSHSYIHNCEEREEAGTPDILADIRCGLVYRLHSLFSCKFIAEREFSFSEYLLKNWRRNPRIHLLGPLGLKKDTTSQTNPLVSRMGIISFLIKYGNALNHLPEITNSNTPNSVQDGQRMTEGGLYLHHHFVVALLNDLFGIQARGGCACAGPYGQYLLGLTDDHIKEVEECLERTGQEVMRPGFVRISVHYSMSWDDIETLSQAVLWIADFGWKLLPAYTFVPETGEWEHRITKPDASRRWLSNLPLIKFLKQHKDIILSPENKDLKEDSSDNNMPDNTITSHEKKNPKHIAGAVSLFGTNAIPNNFQCTIQHAIATLKRPEKTVANASISDHLHKETMNAPPSVSELEQKLAKRRLVIDKSSGDTHSDQPIISSISTVPFIKTPHSNLSYNTSSSNVPSSIPIELPSMTTLQKETPQMMTSSGNSSCITYSDNRMLKIPNNTTDLIQENYHILDDFYKNSGKSLLTTASRCTPPLPEDYSSLLWFALPIDAAFSLISNSEKPQLAESISYNFPHRPESSYFEVRIFDNHYDAAHNKITLPVSVPLLKTSLNENILQRIDDILLKDSTTLLNTSTSVSSIDSTILKFLQIQLEASRNSEQSHMTNEDNTTVISTNTRNGSLPSSNSNMSVPLPLIDVTSNLINDSQQIDPLTSVPMIASATHFLTIPKILRRHVGQAIRDFNMVQEGDRLLIGLSGGKDSLSLLHILRDAQRRSPVKFSLAAATVDPQTPEYNPQPLIEYVQSLGIPYHFLSYPLIELAKIHMQKQSICAFCSRMKRGILYNCMRQNQYNVLVLGQHLDDICESFIMSAFHNGSLNTMKAHYTIQKQDIRVCRPLIYTREKLLNEFAIDKHLPVITDNCPACFSQPKERHRIKLLLAHQEYEFPHLFKTLLQTLKPLISIKEVQQSSSHTTDQKVSSEHNLKTQHLEEDDHMHDLAQRLVFGDTDESINTSFKNSIQKESMQPSCLNINDEGNDILAESMLSACSVGKCLYKDTIQ